MISACTYYFSVAPTKSPDVENLKEGDLFFSWFQKVQSMFLLSHMFGQDIMRRAWGGES